MEHIDSESKNIFGIWFSILKLPFTFIMFLFGKKTFGDLFEPQKRFFHFIFEAKGVAFLIIINLITFIALPLLHFTGTFGLSPEQIGFKPSDLFEFNILSMIFSWFIHGSILHLFGNMLFLFVAGRVVERDFGPAKFILIYFVAAIVSSVAYALVHTFLLGDNVGAIGASGAIAGVMAAALLSSPFYLTYVLMGIPLPIIFVVWISIYSDITGFLNPGADNIAYAAHLGGYIAVTILAFFLGSKEKERMFHGLLLNIFTLIVAGVVVYFFVLR